ncbi:hypothetical protein ERO13_A10G214950v2 [Gossypium hirsutum]|nr:hypothetical protein ERO13_A10G214950v2 [Gossypium hirsutum]
MRLPKVTADFDAFWASYSGEGDKAPTMSTWVDQGPPLQSKLEGFIAKYKQVLAILLLKSQVVKTWKGAWTWGSRCAGLGSCLACRRGTNGDCGAKG